MKWYVISRRRYVTVTITITISLTDGTDGDPEPFVNPSNINEPPPLAAATTPPEDPEEFANLHSTNTPPLDLLFNSDMASQDGQITGFYSLAPS